MPTGSTIVRMRVGFAPHSSISAFRFSCTNTKYLKNPSSERFAITETATAVLRLRSEAPGAVTATPQNQSITVEPSINVTNHGLHQP